MHWEDVIIGTATLLCSVLGILLLKPSLLKRSHLDTFRTTPAHGTTSNSSSLSLQNAYNSFLAYQNHVTREFNAYKSKLNALRGAHARYARELGYTAKIARLETAGKENVKLTKAIADLALEEFPQLALHPSPTSAWSFQLNTGTPTVQGSDIARVKESLKHLVRDWSIEGERERRAIHTPILEELAKVPVERRRKHKILVPGSGLGRLGWEIAQMGFDTTTVELSYYMSITLRFLLSNTTKLNQHTIHPYIHWWSHQRSNANTFRGITIPDVVPRRLDNWHIVEGDFLAMHSDGGENRFDTIVTLYFIDTASNLMTYLQNIYYLLKPGGTWINLGPLLYSNATIELSLEEVIRLAELIGFSFDTFEEGRKSRTVPSEYTADRQAMMKWVYQAEFWVAKKRDEEGELFTL